MRRFALAALFVSLTACGGDPKPVPPSPTPPGPAVAVAPGSQAAFAWVDDHFAMGWFAAADTVIERGMHPGEEVNLDSTGEEFASSPPAPVVAPSTGGGAPAIRDVALEDEKSLDGADGAMDFDHAEELEEHPRFGAASEGVATFGGADDGEAVADPEVWQRSNQTPNASRLMVGDDESLPLETFQATVRIDGHRARVVLDLSYRNTFDSDVEGVFKLRLPDETAVHYLAFGDMVEGAPALLAVPTSRAADLSATALEAGRQRGSVQRIARIVPRERAQQAYAAETARAVDPALLEWAGAGVFSTRVYPLPAGKVSRITVAYDVELPAHGGERVFEIDVPEEAKTSRVVFQVSGETGDPVIEGGSANYTDPLKDGAGMQVRSENPAGRLRLHVPATTARPLVGDDAAIGPHFSVNVSPAVPASQGAPRRRAVFLLDTSMSSNPDRMIIWRELLRGILESNRRDLTEFAVLAFNVETWWWRDGFAPNDSATVEEMLVQTSGIALEGATDLGAALAEAASPVWSNGPLDADVFLLSDGAETWGAAAAGGVAARFPAPVFCYTTGLPGTDTRALRALARATGGAVFGVQGRSDVAAASTAHRSRPWTIREIRVAGCEDVLAAGGPATLYPGQRLRLAGRGRPSAGDEVVIAVEQDGRAAELRVPLGAPITSWLAPRAYGEVATGQLEELDEIAADEARAYALHYRVTGKTCSLLMLESEERYAEYGIVPTADADVVRRRPVSAVVDELGNESIQARRDPRAAFLLWLDRLDRLSENAFDGLDTLREAVRLLPVSAFAIVPRPLTCASRTWDAIDPAFAAALRTADPEYDAALAEAARRFDAGHPGDALRALSSLVEADPGSTDLLRDVAFTALDRDAPHAAYGLLLRVARSRPHEPETYRALAECLERMGHADLAILMYELALRGNWDERFGAFPLIAAMDYRGLLRRIERGEATASLTALADDARERIASKYVSGDADLVVTMTWNTDRTDVDLHVTDPSDETCYYGHPRTRLGGAITRDVTGGYGPEMFVLGRAAPGEYAIKAHYYGSDSLRKTLRSRVFVTTTRDFGRPTEHRERKAFVLERQGEIDEVLRLAWE